MDAFETTRIMEILQAAYPGFYRGQSAAQLAAARDLWQDMFADEPYAVVQAAVRVLVKNRANTYPPAIGEVTEQIYKLRHPDELTEEDAWHLVKRAVGNSSYHAAEEYERLPEPVRRCVGSPAQLRDWSRMGVEELDSVVASNFRRAFRVRSRSDREVAALPEEVRVMLTETVAKMFRPLPEA